MDAIVIGLLGNEALAAALADGLNLEQGQLEIHQFSD